MRFRRWPATQLRPIGRRRPRSPLCASALMYLTRSNSCRKRFGVPWILLHNPSVRGFFIRRACRILPLAYLFVLVMVLLWQHKGMAYALAYAGFTINYLPQYVTPITSPLWSLCVEVHFYLAVGILVGM